MSKFLLRISLIDQFLGDLMFFFCIDWYFSFLDEINICISFVDVEYENSFSLSLLLKETLIS